MVMISRIFFELPPKGTFVPNHDVDDPLAYYYKPITGYMYKKRIQLGLNLLNCDRYENVLEFGYGSGVLLPSLAKISKNLYGIDTTSEPSVVNSSLSKLNLRAELKKEDITKAGYPSSYFDLIVGFSVFEHISEPDSILSEMCRILKPDGKLLAGMPMVSGWMGKLFVLIGYNTIDEHHVMNHNEFIKRAGKFFNLEKRNRLFRFIPENTSLYFNILFSPRK
jgi:2-polyprenyl-3-methyl-5-hydroxy-6-metoxy-1,4-benzoquinol methylase